MTFRQLNVLRWRATRLSRAWNVLLGGADGQMTREAHNVLADLRGFCRADGRSTFSNDPLVMARLVGRREVFERIQNYLNLDDAAVQQLMEIDDGIGR